MICTRLPSSTLIAGEKDIRTVVHVLLTGEGHGVDVDCCLLLRVGPCNLVPLSIQLDIPMPGVAHTHEAPGFEGEREPPLLPPQNRVYKQQRNNNPPV